jgi:hypothetical protein
MQLQGKRRGGGGGGEEEVRELLTCPNPGEHTFIASLVSSFCCGVRSSTV